MAYKLQPGGPGYEITYGTTGVLPYLLSLSTGPSGPGTLQDSFALIAAHEQTLVEPLLAFLTAPEQLDRGVRVVGNDKPGPDRVPTISFVVTGQRAMKSKDVVGFFDSRGGVRILSALDSCPVFESNSAFRLASGTATSMRTPLSTASLQSWISMMAW